MTTSNQLGAMMTDAKNIIDSLRKQAAQIAKEGHFGWGNIDNDAADTIERMVAQIALLSESKPAAYVNGFELDSMLPDDETAGPDRTPGIQRTQSQFRSVPLYRTPQIAAPAQSGEALDGEPTTIYSPVYVREKFADYQNQIDGLKEELSHVLAARAASPQATATQADASDIRRQVLEEAAQRVMKILGYPPREYYAEAIRALAAQPATGGDHG